MRLSAAAVACAIDSQTTWSVQVPSPVPLRWRVRKPGARERMPFHAPGGREEVSVGHAGGKAEGHDLGHRARIGTAGTGGVGGKGGGGTVGYGQGRVFHRISPIRVAVRPV